MKRAFVLIVFVLVIGLLAGTWWWVRTTPVQAVDLLVAAGLDPTEATEVVARVGGEVAPSREQALVASGTIEGDEVSIVSEFGGQIVRLEVDKGDEVTAGQVVVEFDTSSLDAKMYEAQAGVAVARANLASVKAGTHPAQILVAEAALGQAISEREAARAQWENAQALLSDPQEIQTQIVQTKAEVELAIAQIARAQAQIAAAEAERDRYRGQGSMEEKALYRAFGYQVEAAQAALAAAKANKTGAEKTLKMLETLHETPLALVSQVHMAEQQYQVAEKAASVAEAKLAELKAGPTLEEIAVAEAGVEQARAAAIALQARLDKMILRTPISGVVTNRSAHAGETAMPGATLLKVANLDQVRLTVYIPEDELGRVYLGQEVEVRVDSFPDKRFEGTVAYIAQEAEFTPKNVQTEEERMNMVFAVRLHLDNPDHVLKLGMPADATLGDR